MGNQVSTSNDRSDLQKSECPVKHEMKKAETSGCPVQHNREPSSPSSPESGGCPVQHSRSSGSTRGKTIYNVYSQPIDPTNMMPYNPNQEPRDEQRYPLKQDRVQSTIPKGGTDGQSWLYPSEQMFFNALRRKGKGDDVHEGDMSTIVSIHNNMNERSWAQVEHYENVTHPGSQPQLLKFIGRPDRLTPIAWMKHYLLGHEKPFDRHDWTIIRVSDNTEQRYVIDYYFDVEKGKEDLVPSIHSEDSIKSISMHARPAIDSISSLIDRLKFPLVELISGVKEPALATRSELLQDPIMNSGVQSASNEHISSEHEKLTPEQVEETFKAIKSNCAKAFQLLQNCEDEVTCTAAATGLQLCMGKIICPPQAHAFTDAIESGGQQDIERTFDDMNTKINIFQERSSDVMQAQAVEEARTNPKASNDNE